MVSEVGDNQWDHSSNFGRNKINIGRVIQYRDCGI